MKYEKEDVLNYLDNLNIEYELMEHEEIKTIEEMEKIFAKNSKEVVKNLFLRDDKKKRYFIISIQKDKKINLKELSQKINSRPLSFGSEESLFKILKLKKGEVTPLGILNSSNAVEVIFDDDIKKFKKIGIHPNDNKATIWIKPIELENLISKNGNKFSYIKI